MRSNAVSVLIDFLEDISERSKKKIEFCIQISLDYVEMYKKGKQRYLKSGAGIKILDSSNYFFTKKANSKAIINELLNQGLLRTNDADLLVQKYEKLLEDDILVEDLELEDKLLINLEDEVKTEIFDDYSLIERFHKQYFFSEGRLSYEQRNYYYFSGRINGFYKNIMTRKISELTQFIRELGRRNVDEEEKEEIKLLGGIYDIVFPAGIGALFLHECVGHCLEIQNARCKNSLFSNKIGQQIASELFTLIDDPSMPDMWGSMIFDDAGVKTMPIVLIDKGVLKNYMVDKYQARELGISYTSSARREKIDNKPAARMSNTYLKEGEYSQSMVISSLDEGLIIRDISHGSINPITGDFHVKVRLAEKVKNGMKEGFVRNFYIKANTFDVLKNVTMVANDLKFENGMCNGESGIIPVSAGQPTMRINSLLCEM